MSNAPLESIESFVNDGSVIQLKPLREGVFSSSTLQLLDHLYTQLYPHHTVSLPPFYTRSGRIVIGGQLIGSVMNRCSANSSSVIMSFWPSNGDDLSPINYSRMRVGVVQEFYKHIVLLKKADSNLLNLPLRSEHIIAKVFLFFI